ncbi:MAG TPA: amidohydrolase family protein [Mycobacteriales bacterium]
MRLVDHHCHGVLRGELDRAGFEALLSEGGAPPPGLSTFDTPLGLAVRRHCAPVLDLPPHAGPDDYLARRAELGSAEVARRLLRTSGVDAFCVDTGFRGGELTTPAELAALAGGTAHEVVRLETVAESLADGDPGDFAARFREALVTAVARTGAVAVKSVAAYRCGLELLPAPPPPAVLAEAVAHRRPGPVRSTVISSALVWTAVSLGLPVQFHVGYGDRDLTLHRSDPSLLTAFLHAVPPEVPVLLLHCYPYHRTAGYLAAVYGNVYVDVGLALNHLGPSRAGALSAEAMDGVPFGKMLYSSDAFGLPELYALGALTFRRGLAEVLDSWVSAGECTRADAERIAVMIGSGNAERVYGLGQTRPVHSGAGVGRPMK